MMPTFMDYIFAALLFICCLIDYLILERLKYTQDDIHSVYRYIFDKDDSEKAPSTNPMSEDRRAAHRAIYEANKANDKAINLEAEIMMLKDEIRAIERRVDEHEEKLNEIYIEE